MTRLPDDLLAPVPVDLSDEEAREYELRLVAVLRDEAITMPREGGILELDAVELVGSRPDTLVVLRYHYRGEYVDRDPSLASGPQAEVARLWGFALDSASHFGTYPGPGDIAVAIASAFDASELDLIDPVTLTPIGRPPRIFPRLGGG